MSDLATIDAKLERLARAVEQLAGPSSAVAVRRAVAAQMMGISRRKLEKLIAAGDVRTAEDAHLVPVVEVKRYCAPKVKRERKPGVGQRARKFKAEGWTEESIAELDRKLRAIE